MVVETSESSCTIYVAFPGLYLTYGINGKLIETETIPERILSGKPLANSENFTLQGEMGG